MGPIDNQQRILYLKSIDGVWVRTANLNITNLYMEEEKMTTETTDMILKELAEQGISVAISNYKNDDNIDIFMSANYNGNESVIPTQSVNTFDVKCISPL